MPEIPELLPPEHRGIISNSSRWESPKWKAARPFVLGVSAMGCLGFVLWGLNQFLSLRGVVHVVASRIVLAFTVGAAVLMVLAITRFLRTRRNLSFGAGTIVVIVLAVLLDWWAPKPKEASTAHIPKPAIDVSLALITTIHRMRDRNGGYMRGGQNDLIGILRVRQHDGKSIRHVKSLQVVGDVAGDFGSYLAWFSKGDGTESVDDIENRYAKDKRFSTFLGFLFLPFKYALILTMRSSLNLAFHVQAVRLS
jgi:hypothetical protein